MCQASFNQQWLTCSTTGVSKPGTSCSTSNTCMSAGTAICLAAKYFSSVVLPLQYRRQRQE
jgi:hypothetical protein